MEQEQQQSRAVVAASTSWDNGRAGGKNAISVPMALQRLSRILHMGD